jgi:hypothetical protein
MTPGGVVVDRAAGALPVHRGVRNLPVKVPHVPVEVSNLPAGVPHVLADLPNLSVEVPDLLVETPDLPVEVQDVHAELGHVPVEVPNLAGHPGKVPGDPRNLAVEVRHALKQDSAPCARRLPYADAELRSAQLGSAPLCSGFASALLKSAGHDGPLLYPGPLCSGEAGSTGRIAGIGMDVDAFSPGQATAWMPELRQRRSSCPMPCRKARPRLADFPGKDARKARKRGASLFGYFLSGKREKVTRPPKEDESSSL